MDKPQIIIVDDISDPREMTEEERARYLKWFTCRLTGKIPKNQGLISNG